MLVAVQQDSRVLRLTLNRPEKRNALNVALCQELIAAIEKADTDPAVGAILLTGNGKAFCAGMDLSEALQPDRTEMDEVHEKLFTIGYRLRKPIVAGVHGAALAGGTGLAANAHILVAGDDAQFGLTEIRIGLWPILIFRAMKAAVGERRATELALTGRRFTAQEAVTIGLAHEVSSTPIERAEAIAKQISEFSADAIGAGFNYVNQTRDKSWDEAGRIGREIRAKALDSPDFKEKVNAFLSDRR
jgi:enoyl-CoA hydratase/carnithine racemase